jgi:hypothetical protein
LVAIAFVLRLQRRTQWKCWSLSPLFLGYRGELSENVWLLSALFLDSYTSILNFKTLY